MCQSGGPSTVQQGTVSYSSYLLVKITVRHRNIVQTEFKPRWRGELVVRNWLTLAVSYFLSYLISKLFLKIVSSVGIVRYCEHCKYYWCCKYSMYNVSMVAIVSIVST